MSDSDTELTSEEPLPPVPVLTLSYDHSINYAFQQNAIPVVKELHFKNDATPRKDLMIRVTTEPAFAARYLLGVECDGATYHRAATARDRDKLRQMILEDLGWKLHRVWSTDWWHDASGQMNKLLSELSLILAAREAVESVNESVANNTTTPKSDMALLENVEPTDTIKEDATSAGAVVYQVTDFSGFLAIIYPERFYDHGYDQTLCDLIAHVMIQEAPILEDLLVQRISRAHGFQKAGRLIWERVIALAGRHHHIQEDPLGGRFVWHNSDSPGQWSAYRVPTTQADGRKIEEIAFEELRAAALASNGPDLPVEIARKFGVQRLVAASRARLEAAEKIVSAAATNAHTSSGA